MTEIRLSAIPNAFKRPAEESDHQCVCVKDDYSALPSLLCALCHSTLTVTAGSWHFMLCGVVPPVCFVLSPVAISNAYFLPFLFSFLLSPRPVPCLSNVSFLSSESNVSDLFRLPNLVMLIPQHFLDDDDRYQRKQRPV